MIIIIYLNTKQSLQAQPGSMSQHVESEAQWRIEQVNTRGIYFSKTSHYLINRELIDPYIKLQAKMYATKTWRWYAYSRANDHRKVPQGTETTLALMRRKSQ